MKGKVLSIIQSSVDHILDAKGLERVKVSEDTTLLNDSVPIDSVDLAQIVVELQGATGVDPFEAGFLEFRTAGELASLFAGMQPPHA